MPDISNFILLVDEIFFKKLLKSGEKNTILTEILKAITFKFFFKKNQIIQQYKKYEVKQKLNIGHF